MGWAVRACGAIVRAGLFGKRSYSGAEGPFEPEGQVDLDRRAGRFEGDLARSLRRPSALGACQRGLLGGLGLDFRA